MIAQPRSVRGACPLDCPDTCSWIVTVDNGVPSSLRGDPSHPYTRGALCNKVIDYLAYARSSERILFPLRRTGRKGDGRFTRIGWEEALTVIAGEMRRAITTDSPDAIWPFIGSGNMGLLQGVYGAGERLWNVLGVSKHHYNLCTVAGGVGTGFTLGHNRVGMDPEGFKHSKLIILWGANPISTHPHFWRPVTEARKHGAFVVTIDPLRTRTAAASDWHLAPRPGTDAALALGVMHVVIEEDRLDRAFIERYTAGWDQFSARIREFDPTRVAEITGLPVESIVELGRRVAESRPTGIRIGIGLQRHAGGGTAVRTISCIPGVTGDWRYPGGGAFYDTRGHFGLNWQALWRDDLCRRLRRPLYASRLGESLINGEPPVNVLLICGANPAASAPAQSKVRHGLSRADLFTVVVEHFLTDTARYADVVLPATMQIEHRDLLISYGHLYLAMNEAVVAPPGECLPTTEVFRRLAGALGMTEPALYDSDEAMMSQLLDSGHPSLAGITLESLRHEGSIRLNYPDPFVPFASGFPTESGRLEFVSQRMAREGLDPVAGFVPPRESADSPAASTHPFVLITPANHYFLNSTFANVPRQLARAGEPAVTIHPEDAAPLGIVAGDRVRVSNDRGAFIAIADVSDAVRRGVLASPKGRWPQLTCGGATANATVSDGCADLGAGSLYHDNRVSIEKL